MMRSFVLTLFVFLSLATAATAHGPRHNQPRGYYHYHPYYGWSHPNPYYGPQREPGYRHYSRPQYRGYDYRYGDRPRSRFSYDGSRWSFGY